MNLLEHSTPFPVTLLTLLLLLPKSVHCSQWPPVYLGLHWQVLLLNSLVPKTLQAVPDKLLKTVKMIGITLKFYEVNER